MNIDEEIGVCLDCWCNKEQCQCEYQKMKRQSEMAMELAEAIAKEFKIRQYDVQAFIVHYMLDKGIRLQEEKK